MHADPKGVLTGVHFLDGDHACCEGTLAAGARFAAGYPITPSTEVVERFASRIPTVGGIFIQMEDELAAWRGGVDRLLEAAEPDPTLGQAGDGVDQMPQGAAEAVELQTTGVSPGRSWSRTRVRVGRSVRAPLAVWVNTR